MSNRGNPREWRNISNYNKKKPKTWKFVTSNQWRVSRESFSGEYLP
jgi:hypothetical protein